jgi:HPt (histidine-containing phosphotransfer) domain-containing protein
MAIVRGPDKAAEIAKALDGMWTRFLPEIRERVAALEAAAAALAGHTLTASQQHEARAAAHKLAGVLGVFNLPHGTALARELELLYSRESPLDPALGPRPAALAAELRATVESRK